MYKYVEDKDMMESEATSKGLIPNYTQRIGKAVLRDMVTDTIETSYLTINIKVDPGIFSQDEIEACDEVSLSNVTVLNFEDEDISKGNKLLTEITDILRKNNISIFKQNYFTLCYNTEIKTEHIVETVFTINNLINHIKEVTLEWTCVLPTSNERIHLSSYFLGTKYISEYLTTNSIFSLSTHKFLNEAISTAIMYDYVEVELPYSFYNKDFYKNLLSDLSDEGVTTDVNQIKMLIKWRKDN